MAINPIGAGAAAAQAVTGGGAGAAFDGALSQAQTDKMMEGAVQVMSQLLMRHGNEMLSDAMEDDEG